MCIFVALMFLRTHPINHLEKSLFIIFSSWLELFITFNALKIIFDLKKKRGVSQIFI